ncbi:MAG TPA: hypothetical protein VGY58_20915 [Gemmataceae bacterium]|jgi:hypothetical protein|nr:hypothetical protein [Gemmataceae bacterium]
MTLQRNQRGHAGDQEQRGAFNPQRMQRALVPYFVWLGVFLGVLSTILQAVMLSGEGHVSETEILGVPLYDTQGPITFGILSMGPLALGLVSFGGLAVGGIAFGGGAVGIVAIGGGAIGLIAMGGGALGVIAIGGGAVGYIAVGGGAVGRYTLGGGGAGKYVLSYTRQDEEAVRLFCKYLPPLRRAFAPVEAAPDRAGTP